MLPTRVHRDAVVDDVVNSRRLHALFAAHRTVSADLSLPATLERIVAAACELVGAGCGALGVLAADGTYDPFVQQGMDRTSAQRLAEQRGCTALRNPLVEPQVVRVSDLQLDCGAQFVAVPIQVRGEVIGVLFLAAGPGAGFDAADHELLAGFALAAGTAVENARLHQDARRSHDWLNASGEIARALLADADENTLFEVVSRALQAAEADYGSVILPTADGKLEVAVVVGLGAGEWRGHVFDPAESDIGRAIVGGESRIIPELPELAAPGYQNVHQYGPAMLAPLIDAEGVRGAVMLIRAMGRPLFTPYELELVMRFADQVALALHLNDARADAESLRTLEDRHRIAQELHDNVIQRMFAIGVGLERLAVSPLPREAVERLNDYVTELDATINEIRERVFGLRSAPPARAPRAHHRFPRVPAASADPNRRTAEY